MTDRLPSFGKNVLARCWMNVTHFVAHISPVDGKRHLSFGDTPVQHITHWMPLPGLPQGSEVV